MKGYQNEVIGYDTEKYVRLVSKEQGYYGYRKSTTETYNRKKASPAQEIVLDCLNQCYQDKKANPTSRP